MQFPMINRKGLRNRKRNHASSTNPNWLSMESNTNRFQKYLHEEEEEESFPKVLPHESNMNGSHKNLQEVEEEGSIPNLLPHESNMNLSIKNLHGEGGGGLPEESTPTGDYESIPEIIDISDKEDDDDMDLQLALFNSCNVDKSPQIIDLKRKGILSSSAPLTPSQRFYRFYQTGESSVTECVICKETMSSGEVLRTNDKCRHPFCEDCIKNYIGEKLQENILEIKCPEEKCQQVLEKSLWQQFIPERLGWLMKQARIEGSVLQDPNIFWCPNEECSELIVDDEKGFLIRACPNCWKFFCARCMDPWHTGMTCIEFKRWKEERLRRLQAVVLQALTSPRIIFIRR